MFCGACGQENPTEHTFCSTCGKPLKIDTSSLQTPEKQYSVDGNGTHAQKSPIDIDKLDLNVLASSARRNSMAQLARCKSCDKEVARTARTCPHCGDTFPGLGIKCPACGGTNIGVGGQRGFSLTGAAAWAFLVGPLGLLGGMIGRKQIELECQRCRKKWMSYKLA